MLHQVSTLVYRLGTGIAKDVHPTMLAEIVEECIGDNVVRFREVMAQVTVEQGNLFGKRIGEAIIQIVNQ